MGFLGSFGNSIRALGSKALSAVHAIGQKVSNVAGTVSNVAKAIAPSLSTIPGIGGAASGLANTVGNVANKVQNYAGLASGVAGNLNDRLSPGQAPPQ